MTQAVSGAAPQGQFDRALEWNERGSTQLQRQSCHVGRKRGAGGTPVDVTLEERPLELRQLAVEGK